MIHSHRRKTRTSTIVPNRMERKKLKINQIRQTCIGSTVVAANDVSFLREKINKLALAFIAPLATKNSNDLFLHILNGICESKMIYACRRPVKATSGLVVEGEDKIKAVRSQYTYIDLF